MNSNSKFKFNLEMEKGKCERKIKKREVPKLGLGTPFWPTKRSIPRTHPEPGADTWGPLASLPSCAAQSFTGLRGPLDSGTSRAHHASLCLACGPTKSAQRGIVSPIRPSLPCGASVPGRSSTTSPQDPGGFLRWHKRRGSLRPAPSRPGRA